MNHVVVGGEVCLYTDEDLISGGDLEAIGPLNAVSDGDDLHPHLTMSIPPGSSEQPYNFCPPVNT